MTIQKVNRRNDWWSAYHKVNGKLYNAFASSLSRVIESIMQEMEKDGHYFVAGGSKFYQPNK